MNPRYPLLSDNEMDDIETKSQLATLDRLIEKYQARKRLQASPPQDTSKPNN
jgi:hypothetical protein